MWGCQSYEEFWNENSLSELPPALAVWLSEPWVEKDSEDMGFRLMRSHSSFLYPWQIPLIDHMYLWTRAVLSEQSAISTSAYGCQALVIMLQTWLQNLNVKVVCDDCLTLGGSSFIFYLQRVLGHEKGPKLLSCWVPLFQQFKLPCDCCPFWLERAAWITH